MGALEFIAALVESLAWPLVVLVVVLVFRRPLQDVIRGLKRLNSPGGWAATFENQVERVREIAQDFSESSGFPVEDYPPIPWVDDLDTRTKVVSAWWEVDRQLQIIAAKLQLRSKGESIDPNTVISELLERELIADGFAMLLRDLYDLRNRVAHDHRFEVSDPPLQEYYQAVSIATAGLNSVMLDLS